MEVQKSIMELIEVNIFESSVKLILPEQDQDEINTNDYAVDIDFNIREANDDCYVVSCGVVVNRERKTGYSIKVLGACAFKFNEVVSDDDRQQLLFNSGVSICIANLRAYMANITSYNSFFQQYLLPTIDMNHLLNAKIESQANTESE